jgi:TPR repeat protein
MTYPTRLSHLKLSSAALLVALLALCPAFQASAQEPLRLPDFTVEQVEEAADEGDAEALYILATVYFKGSRVPRNFKKAAELYTRAGELGLALAQIHLGEMYFDGTKVPQNDRQALRWYQVAALQGMPNAQFGMGRIYAEGQGAPQDFGIAARWYEQAAMQGHGKSQHELGLLYAAGAGVPQEAQNAYKWLALAASQGITEAVSGRDEVRKAMTADQLAAAQREAAAFQATPHYNASNLQRQVSNIMERAKGLVAAAQK